MAQIARIPPWPLLGLLGFQIQAQSGIGCAGKEKRSGGLQTPLRERKPPDNFQTFLATASPWADSGASPGAIAGAAVVAVGSAVAAAHASAPFVAFAAGAAVRPAASSRRLPAGVPVDGDPAPAAAGASGNPAAAARTFCPVAAGISCLGSDSLCWVTMAASEPATHLHGS